MKNMQLVPLSLLGALALLGCDGQQYVSADTALLTISHDSTGSKLIEGCSYVPVLLGSQVQKRYVADDDLSAIITLTRSKIVVTFEGPAGDGVEPFQVATNELESGSATADDPPSGYTVELGSGCTPDEP
jgi:hypothetical protein